MRLKKLLVIALAAVMSMSVAVPALAVDSPEKEESSDSGSGSSGGGGGGGGGGGASGAAPGKSANASDATTGPGVSGAVGTTGSDGSVGTVLYGWQYDANKGKWWYKYNDSTWAVGWANLYWKPAPDQDGYYAWYHFDGNGWMDTGFFHDADNRDYYLYPVSDGTMGRMVTGDYTVDGVTYSFETEAGQYQGHLKNILR